MKSFLKPLQSLDWKDGALYVILSFLILQWALATARVPVFWFDEAFMVEPSWHLATSGKSRFNLLVNFPQDAPYGMNYPLFSSLLAVWIGIWGFDIISIRLFPLLVTALAMAIGIRALVRMGLIRGQRQVILLLVLWMLTHAAFYASHHARPECLTMLVVAMGLWACTFGTRREALCGLFGLSMLVPYCGLHMVIPVAFAVAASYLYGKLEIRQATTIMLGVLTGVLSFYLIYKWTGAWESYQANVRLVGGDLVMERVMHFVQTKHLELNFVQSSVVVLLFSLTTLSFFLKNRGTRLHGFMLAVSAYCVATVISMRFLANFHTWLNWLNWLAIIPAIACIVVLLCEKNAFPLYQRGAILALLIVLLLHNNQSRALAFSHLIFWDQSNPGNIERQLMNLDITGSDVVLGNDAAYIALRPKAGRFHSLSHVQRNYQNTGSMDAFFPEPIAKAVDWIIIDLSESDAGILAPLQQWCGGAWAEIPVPHTQWPALPSWLTCLPLKNEHFIKCYFRVFKRL